MQTGVFNKTILQKKAASPTVALDLEFVTAAIDARENREVVTIDIPFAFLHANKNNNVVIHMNETLAELMTKRILNYTGNT